jgi:AbrB family looped-hinge helix DNA binding protein
MPSRTVQAQRATRTSALSRIRQRRQVIIPKKVFDALALAEGDLLEVTAENGGIAMKLQTPAYAGDTLTAADAKKVRHAMAQLTAGKTRPWAKVKHDLGL